MDTQRLRRIAELAGPIIEDWVRRDPAHRVLAAEIAAWLHEMAEEKVTRMREGTSLPPLTHRAPPVSQPTPKASSRGEAQALIDKLVAEFAMPGKPSGGLAPAPATARGVRPIETPILKAPPARTPKPPETPERRNAADLALQKAAYHRGQMDKCLQAKDHAAAVLHMGRVVSSIDAWVTEGGDAGEARARAIIAESLAALPSRDALPRDTEAALDRLARRMDAAEEDDEEPGDGNIRAEAARLLAGKAVVLIGGNVREERRAALERELGMGELRWIRSTPTNPALKFEADLKKRDVALVLLAIRWVRHATGYAVAETCVKAGKPLVRLPGGLGTNTVAAAVVSQAAGALA